MKQKLKAAMTVVLTALLLTCGTFAVSSYAHSFQDVTQYDEAIGLLSEIGVIKGYSETVFSPDTDVTRWQMALLMSKLITGNVDTAYWEAKTNETSFGDVEVSRHYLSAIKYASDHGIIKGRSSEVFDPDAGITLQEGVTMAVRGLGYPAGDYDGGYPASYLAKANDLGLLSGIENLSGTDTLTRGQTAQLLYNMAFAETYSGNAYIDTAFDYKNERIELVSTQTYRISSLAGYARDGEALFMTLDDYGRLSSSFRTTRAQAASYLGVTESELEHYVGSTLNMVSTNAHSNILSVSINSLPQLLTGNVSLLSALTGQISIYGSSYSVVSAYTEPHLANASTRELIVYAGNDTSYGSSTFVSGNTLTAAKIGPTLSSFRMRIFDDNQDGYADRAIYIPYSFGCYSVDSKGTVAIASKTSLDDLTVVNNTSKSVSDGDYVMYSYDSQTKTLEIAKIYTKITGTKTVSYTAPTASSQAILTVSGNMRYYIGNDLYPGADGTDVEKLLAGEDNLGGCEIDMILDENGYIIWAELHKTVSNLSGTVYYDDMSVVTKITATADFKPAVCLDGSDTAYPVKTVDGTTSAASLALGDFVAVTQDSDQNVELVRKNGYAAYTTSTSDARLSVSGDTFVVTENKTAALTVRINAQTVFVTFNGTTTPTVVTKENFSDLLEGYKIVYVSYGRTNTAYAKLVYIRIFDATILGREISDFNGMIYINKSQLENFETSQTSSGNYFYTYDGLDIITGTVMTKAYQVATVNVRLTEPGLYRVINGYIVHTEPLSANCTGALYTCTAEAMITAIESNASGYSLTIDGMSFFVPTAELKIYSRDNVGLLTDVTSKVKPKDTLYNASVSYLYVNASYVNGMYYGALYIII